MRRFLVGATVLAIVMAFGPAPAAQKTLARKKLTFKAAAACAVACAHNMEDNGSIAGLADLDNPASAHFQACSNPFPSGAYADFVVTVPKKANTLVFSISPIGDWDSFICTAPKSGKSREVANGVNTIEGTEVLGVQESIAIRVKPGQRYILRAYNWADVEPCPGEYKFMYVT